MTTTVDTPSRTPVVLLGLGLGGFVDGILLHQVLQWHHMISDTSRRPTSLPDLEANTLGDGLFHTATWLLVLLGVALLVRDWRSGRGAPSAWAFTGLLLVGWGVFNLVEGLVNHQVLGVHHVRDDLGGPLSWDIGFLLLGALLVAGGWAMQRRDTG